MTKELIDLAWRCLPKEFKEEVKELYEHENEVIVPISGVTTLNKIFGYHNLTSDAEGEEILTVSRKVVQEEYRESINKAHPYNINSYNRGFHVGCATMLKELFGSKCLPDDGDEVTKEPKPAEPNPDGDELSPELQPANRTPASYTQPVTDCPQIDRLHIAAMAMQALLSNADRMKRYEDIASDPLSDNLTRIVARNALRYADALVAETQKGGEK